MLTQLLQLATLVVVCGASTKRIDQLYSSAFAIPGFNASYDYIVIGGGTAGLTIASRLAKNASVAVVEAGGVYQVENGNNSVVPFYAFGMGFLVQTEDYPRQPLIDWDLVSQPQSGAGNRRIHYARGKTLGGSSAINTMAYNRGTKGFYKRWADFVGDSSYEWDSLLPFFKKSATLTPPNWGKRATPNATFTYDPSAFDSVHPGPLDVSWANYVDPSQTWLAKAVQAINLPLSALGLDSGILSGFGAWTTTTISPEHATRSTSASSYLHHAIATTEIMIYTHTQATKILFDSGKATGVSVSTQGLRYTLSATKEVILSAGVFHSPQLLLVSGLGPRAALESLDIPVVADLPGVGQNLQDQINFQVASGLKVPSAIGNALDPNQKSENLRRYLQDAAGPFSSAGGYLSFEKLPAASRANFSARTAELLERLAADEPEIEYIGVGVPTGDPDLPTTGVISPTLLAPFSKGSVTISSADVADQPVIDLGWLSDPADGEVAVAALKRCRQAWAASVLEPVKAGGEIAPGAGVVSDDDLLAFIRNTAATIYHASGTCAMGAPGDRLAVVDAKARVFGVERLRVVDASVFPFAVPCHPQATVYALAEKIAEAILSGQ